MTFQAGSPKILVLVERIEHVPEAVTLLEQNRGETLLVALSPAVIRELNKKAVPYVTPELYIPARELNQYGLKNYDLLEDLLRWVAARSNDWPDSLRINPIEYDYFRLKLLIDSFSLRVRELLAIIEKEKPRRLVVFASDRDAFWASFEGDSFIEHDGPIYAEIAPSVAKALQLECEIRNIKHSKIPSRGMGWTKELRQQLFLVKERAKMLASFRYIAFPGIRPVAWQFSVKSHDIPSLIELYSKRFKVVLWGNLWKFSLFRRFMIRRPMKSRREDLQFLQQWWEINVITLSRHEIFRASVVNFFPLIERVFQFRFVQGHSQACEIFEEARRLIRSHRPSIAFGISSPFYQIMVFALALKRERIPVILAQEGGLYGYCLSPMHHYTELSVADYYLSYGPGVSERLESLRLTSRQKARVLPVGARGLRQSPARVLPSPAPKHRVMYIPTSDFHHDLRYAPVHYSDRDYFDLKQRVIQALLERSDADVIYKSMPDTWRQDTISQTINEHRGRITVNQDPLKKVLENILELPDVFVVDWPTTTLLEVLCTRRPVIVLMDREALETFDTALPMLRRRARVFLDKDEFIRELREGPLCETHEDVNDSAFIDAFATGGKQAWSDDKILEYPFSAATEGNGVMKRVAVIQARMGSTRLPGKTLMKVAGKPLLEHLIERLKSAKRIDEIVVATTSNPEDAAIEDLCRRLQVGCFRGSSEDVLGRVSQALARFAADIHVEIHGDGPLLDWRVVDRAVQIFESDDYDLVTNALTISYPPGLEVWVYRAALAHQVERIAREPQFRESPALYLTQHPERYRLHNFVAPPELTAPETYLEVDTDVDMSVIREIVESLYPKNPAFTTEQVLAWMNAHRETANRNQHVERRWKKVAS